MFLLEETAEACHHVSESCWKTVDFIFRVLKTGHVFNVHVFSYMHGMSSDKCTVHVVCGW